MSALAPPRPAARALRHRHRVVVVGGGFAGLQAAKALRGTEADVTLVDRRNFHLFQPLVYQVATGALSPGEVAAPLRSIFRDAPNVDVVLGEVTGIDLDAREVHVEPVVDGTAPATLPFDTLVAAGGSTSSYFGHEEWREHAPEIKSLESALETRRRILAAFEAAALEPDPARRAAWLTFVVVGGGPTGVEMIGQIAEIARDTLPGEFRAIDTAQGRMLLVEAADRVLPAFRPAVSASAQRAVEGLGVEVRLGTMVTGVDAGGVTVRRPDGTSERVPARTAIWAAGVQASPLAALVARAAGAPLDAHGRVEVGPDLTVAGRPDVIAVGDMVTVRGDDGRPLALPGVAPVAMQEGRHAAAVVRARLAGERPQPFRYHDKGDVATIGRAKAVADLRVVRLSGLPAWLLWLGVHLFYLVGFQNRLLVALRWSISFATRGRGARLITGPSAAAA